MTMSTPTLITAVIPVKRLGRAKQRLDVPAAIRSELAEAFARDVIHLTTETPGVGRIVVVTSEPAIRSFARRHGAHALPDPIFAGEDRLNAAVRRGVSWAERHHPDDPVVIVPADLPSLRSDVLAQALETMKGFERAFIPDDAGTGTSLLFAARPRLLRPAYGRDSAARHARLGHVELWRADIRLSHDVDEIDQLWRALGLGVNEYTFSVAHKHALLTGRVQAELEDNR